MLLTLTHEYRELYECVVAHLCVRDALALASTCTITRAAAHDHVRHFVRFARALHTLRAQHYRTLSRIYTWLHTDSYGIVSCEESIRMCTGVATAYYLVRETHNDGTMAVASVNTHTGVSTMLISYMNHATTCASSRDTLRTWCSYYTWTARQLQLHNIMTHHDPHNRILALLSRRDRCALACTNYTHFARYMSKYTSVQRKN